MSITVPILLSLHNSILLTGHNMVIVPQSWQRYASAPQVVGLAQQLTQPYLNLGC